MIILCSVPLGWCDDIGDRRVTVSVPRQPLHQAMEKFCRQTNLQFLSTSGRITYAISNAVKGEYPLQQALQILLQDTGFRHRFSDEKTITLHLDSSLVSDTASLLAGSYPSATQAQEDAVISSRHLPFGERYMEEILVSARLHQERLLDTPMAVTKVSIHEQRDRDLNDLTDSTRLAPNVDFSFGGTSSGSTSAAVMYIRGVGQNDFTPVTDPGVGVYIDGVYLGRTLGSVIEITDLESIQILRGPQGTLFGRNTIGGAILLQSRSPTEEFELSGNLTVGEQGRKGVNVSANIPIAGNAGLRLSYTGRRMDEYVDRVLTGDALGDEHTDTLRGKLVMDLDQNRKLSLSADFTRERESSAPETLTHIYTESAFVQAHNQEVEQRLPDVSCSDTSPAAVLAGCLTTALAAAPYRSFETGPSRNHVDSAGFSLTFDSPLTSAIDLKSITAVRDIDAHFNRSSDGTPVTVIQTADSYQQRQWSQELRLQSSGDQSRFFWVGGLYFMSEKSSNFSIIESTLPTYPIFFGGKTNNYNQAIFFEGSYKPTPKWLLSLGARLTYENKSFLPTSVSLPSNTHLVEHSEETLSFVEPSWRLSALYHPSEDSSLYLTLSRGFKSGGFVHRYFEPAPDGLITFEPEYVTQYEMGYKQEFPQHMLRFNALAFYSDYIDIQTAANPAGQPATITDNAARGYIMGLETELTWYPTASIKVEGSLGLQRAAYDEIGSDNVTVDLDDDFIRTPSASLNMGITHIYPEFLQGSLVSRLDWTLRSRIEYEPDNDPHVAENGYQVFDASWTYEPYEEGWSLRCGVHNLTDERYIIAGDSNRSFGYALTAFARPRHWYLSLDWKL
ncbi:TonB-dependent receptor [Pseudomaricurvus alkylphenolicus]|uniref:TonB-dependent receptor n=1 Tax=Pseudomaricurvus alkylphenolicus TaxID=1306991 RepID=UPI0014225FB9|nr:TonB-dependent receptor [Pseudomaricurvus alkylphenolicus]NIB38770.1 TonB-dependent receptor [Pseudomaricurvus alkylphenolicus]